MIRLPRHCPITHALGGQPSIAEETIGNGGEESTKLVLNQRGGLNCSMNSNGQFPEKILLLGAWHEARGGATPWRSADMDDTFKLAKESPPQISRAISRMRSSRDGYIMNPRTLCRHSHGME